MATGERNFSTEGHKTVKFENKPLTPGEYDVRLDLSKSEVKAPKEPGKFPYINYALRVLGTATKEGGKDRLVFGMLFVSMKKYGESGFQLFTKGDQLVGLTRALGEQYNGPIIQMKDADGVATDVIAPKALLAWLKNFDGTTLRAKIKTQKGTGGYEDKSVVDHFIEAEAADEGGDEPEVDEDEPEVEAEDTGDVEEVDEEPEEEPAPVKKAAPAKGAKQVTKPAVAAKTGRR